VATPVIPQGWKQQGNTKVYEAPIKTSNVSGGFVYIDGRINGSSGEYIVLYRTSSLPGAGRNEVYSVSSDGKVNVNDKSVYDQLKKSGEIEKLDGDIQKRAVEINKAVGTSQEKQQLENSKLYKPVSDRLKNQDGTNLDQNTASKLQNISAKEGSEPRSSYNSKKPYIYPTGLRDNNQDYIQFDIIKYESKKLTTFFYEESNYETKNSIGTICLPIQSQISDNNVINWNEETMNPFEYGAAIASLNMMTGTSPAQITEELIDNVLKNSDLPPNLATAFRAYAARMAVSSQGNLLSRLSGAVINPNLELLFQGPLLRVFNFNFKLTPRNKPEADQVRYIIRAFKEASSVQRGTKDLFLKAPNVFNIKYVKGGTTQDHPSLNRIKTCALRSFSVDYTPGGTYSTFNDANYTMTSYGLQLQFQELEPIYSDDYSTGEESGTGSPVPYTHIGY
jgi:hypothetical protein